jgi:hypothetical protein
VVTAWIVDVGDPLDVLAVGDFVLPVAAEPGRGVAREIEALP